MWGTLWARWQAWMQADPLFATSCGDHRFNDRLPDAGETVWYGGQANELSKERTAYALIEEVHEATKLSGGAEAASSGRGFGEVARGRRSALDFVGGIQSMPLAELYAILGATARPLFADFAGDDWFVWVFTANEFSGDLIESNEGHLKWIPDEEVTSLNLWPSDKIFLPWLEADKIFSARFQYHGDEMFSHEVTFY